MSYSLGERLFIDSQRRNADALPAARGSEKRYGRLAVVDFRLQVTEKRFGNDPQWPRSRHLAGGNTGALQ